MGRRSPSRLQRLAQNPMAVLWLACAAFAAIGAFVVGVVVDGPDRRSSGVSVFAPAPVGPARADSQLLECEAAGSGEVTEGTVDGADPVADRATAALGWARDVGLTDRYRDLTADVRGTGNPTAVLLTDDRGAVVATVEFERVDGRWRMTTISSC